MECTEETIHRTCFYKDYGREEGYENSVTDISTFTLTCIGENSWSERKEGIRDECFYWRWNIGKGVCRWATNSPLWKELTWTFKIKYFRNPLVTSEFDGIKQICAGGIVSRLGITHKFLCSIPGSSVLHVEVSLGKILNPNCSQWLHQWWVNVCEWIPNEQVGSL